MKEAPKDPKKEAKKGEITKLTTQQMLLLLIKYVGGLIKDHRQYF